VKQFQEIKIVGDFEIARYFKQNWILGHFSEGKKSAVAFLTTNQKLQS